MKKFKLVQFDLDGTLAHTVPQIAKTAKHALEELGYKDITKEKVQSYVGNGVSILLIRLMLNKFDVKQDDIDTSLLNQALELYKKYHFLYLKEDFEIYDGVVEGLNYLKSDGYKLAVNTNKNQIFTDPLLEYMGIRDLFDFVLGAGVIEYKKPDAKPLLYVCDKLGIDPSDTLMVGDSLNDIYAAQRANIKVAALTYGYNCNKNLADYNPNYLCKDFNEFMSIFK